MNEFLSTENTRFHQLPKTTQQIILLYSKGTSDKIFNQQHSLTDPYTGKPVPTVNFDGAQIYYKFGQIHRDDDLPAMIYSDETVEYWKNGKVHRDNDLPAVVHPDGITIEYYQNGQRHRDNDLPAVVHPDGITVEYYQTNKIHRDNDLPAIIYSGGTLEYYKNGQQYTPNIE